MDSALADGLAVGVGEGECVRKAAKGQSSNRGWDSHILKKKCRGADVFLCGVYAKSLLLVILFGALIEHPYANTDLEV